MSWLFMGKALLFGSVAAIIALILVEAIARKFCDAKKTLVGEHDPARDGDFDQQEIARRARG